MQTHDDASWNSLLASLTGEAPASVPSQGLEEPEASEPVLQERVREIWTHSWTDGAQEEPDPAAQYAKLTESLGISAPHSLGAPHAPTVHAPTVGDTYGDPRRSVRISRNTQLRANTRPRRIARLVIGAVAAMLVAIAVIPMDWTASIWTGATADAQSYATTRGERKEFVLPDGSRVVLAPASRLGYSTNEQGMRTVTLDGQAYFSVTHDPNRTFTVAAGNTHTRVLGTSFAVRAYSGDATVQVAVAEGKVAVQDDSTSILLLPGDVGRRDSGHPFAIKRGVTVADAFGWMRGKVEFVNAPLMDVLHELERVYDLDVRVEDEVLMQRRISIAFTGKDAAIMLEVISLAVDANVDQHGQTVVLRAR